MTAEGIPMPTGEAYHLIAYDVETGKEVLNWPTVVDSHRYQVGDELDGGWKVIGVRKTSTHSLWCVDVKKSGPEIVTPLSIVNMPE
jgi:hypothetical protein